MDILVHGDGLPGRLILLRVDVGEICRVVHLKHSNIFHSK